MTATPEQLHSALMYCINFARVMLEDSGEFYPFGSGIRPSGEVEAIGADMGVEHPRMEDVFTFLVQRLDEHFRVGRFIGTAVAVNVNVPPQYSPQYPDGLRVTLNSNGYARHVYVPYQIASSSVPGRNYAVTFAEPFAVGLE